MPKKKPSLTILGIDPGKSGGFALLGGGVVLDYSAMPKTERDIYDIVHEYHRFYRIDRVCIEHVTSSPQMGVTSAFTFGMGYGGLRMVVSSLRVPFESIRPQAWQKGLGIPPRKTKKGETKPQFKDRLRRKAQELFPKLDVWEQTLGMQRAVCDALLITEYGRRQL